MTIEESPSFENAISALTHLPEVGAILLAGSRTSGLADPISDYDVYVYSDRPLNPDARRGALAPWCREMEWGNDFWESEDDGFLNDGTPVEFIYRSFDWLEESLKSVVECYQAAVGYSTCLWANLLDSQILFDRVGHAGALQDRFRVLYPSALQRAIVRKNLPLIASSSAAYLAQIEKGIKRNDIVSINHRVSALLASYFDILFAANERLHPGEKRLLHHLSTLSDMPYMAHSDIEDLLSLSVRAPHKLPMVIRRMDARLREFLDRKCLFEGDPQ